MSALGLAGVLLAAPVGAARAWQSQTASERFQQTVQQQQTRDQLQNSQLQQQLHQNVADTAKLPSANNPGMQQQLDLAERAQADRDRAAQQAELDRARNQAALPRLIPQNQPAPARSGG